MTSGILLPGWTCTHCHAFHGEGPGHGELKEGGKAPRTTCRVCGAERPSSINVVVPDGFELVAGLALVDGEITLMQKKIEAYEASERAFKAEIAALEQRVTELQARGTELVLERQQMREEIASHLEFRGLRECAARVRSCAWDKPMR